MLPSRALRTVAAGLLAAVALAAPAVAAPGDLDLTFGQDGVVTINTNAPADEIEVRNGKIVLAGAPSFASSFPDEIWTIARLNASGSLDTTFSGNGLATIPWDADTKVGGLAILSDDRVLIAGTRANRIVLARRSSIGGPDASFGGGDGRIEPLTEPSGYLWTSVTDVLVLPSGKFVVSAVISSTLSSAYPGRTPFGLVGFNADGSLDTTFGDGGVRLGPLPPETFTEGASTLALDSAGRIVAGGNTTLSGTLTGPAMERFSVKGALDTSFGGEGGVFRPLAPVGTRSSFRRIFPQPDGTLVGAGPQRDPTSNAGVGSSALVTRHKPNGRLDLAFDGDGRALVGVTTPGRNADAINVLDADRRPDGRITFIGGRVNQGTFLLRVRPDGTRDPAFGPPVALPDLQPNVALAPDFRYPKAMATQSDGRILVIGNSGGIETRFRLARFQSECLTTISCVALASNVTGSGVTITSTVRSSDISLGILVHRLVGHRRVLVGRRPFGPRSRGRARLRWDFRVNGRRLRAGRYLVTVRALNRRGKVIDLSRSIVVRVPAASRR